MNITIKSDKTLLITGKAAVGEALPVVVKDVQSAEGLVLRVRYGGRDVARFPVADGDAWTLGGTEASCTLNLDTVQARSVFSGLEDLSSEQFVVVVEDSTTLHCVGNMMLKNWPATEGDNVPYDLSDWPNEVDALDSRITSLLATVTNHVSDSSAHSTLFAAKASATDLATHIGSVNPHGLGLSDIGAASAIDLNTHKTAQSAHSDLFAAKASASDFASHVTDQTKSHVTIEEDLLTLSGSIGAHNHSGTGSVKIQHSAMLGSGSKTHAQLEEDILGIVQKLNQVEGENSSFTSTMEQRFEAIAQACETARSMANTNDTLRKVQFTAAMTAIAAAARME